VNAKVVNILKTYGIPADGFGTSEDSSVKNVLTGSVPGAKALPLWLALRDAHPDTGVWPVIRGDASDQREEFEYDPAATLRGVPSGSVREVLRPRLEEQLEILGKLIPDLSVDGNLTLEDLARRVDQSGIHSFSGKGGGREPWPTTSEHTELDLHSTRNVLSKKMFRNVSLSLVVDAQPHEIPAWLDFGNWNECPKPELQVAVLREWGRKYGAVPICLTNDVLECAVSKPPQTEEEALSLASEQWIFCDDIVGQGTQSVRRLAMEIWRSPQWFFWWD
jgi:hypothetical protein